MASHIRTAKPIKRARRSREPLGPTYAPPENHNGFCSFSK